jgi:hypothetical protein
MVKADLNLINKLIYVYQEMYVLQASLADKDDNDNAERAQCIISEVKEILDKDFDYQVTDADTPTFYIDD